MRLSDVVEKDDVNEAMRLIEMSKKSLDDEDEISGRFVGNNIIVIELCFIRDTRPIDVIYSIVREMADPDTVRCI